MASITRRPFIMKKMPSVKNLDGVTSFRDIPFQSEEMKHLLDLEVPDFIENKSGPVTYVVEDVWPDWILNNQDWKKARYQNNDNNVISDILKTPYAERNAEQVSTLAKWLMSVWEIASTMGFKRCSAMSEAMQSQIFEPGQSIVTENERGLTFYIIVSGVTAIHKQGIGNVATLNKGQSFGELALTQGKDLRAASVIAQTR